MYRAVVNGRDDYHRLFFLFCRNGAKKMLWVGATREGHLARTYEIQRERGTHVCQIRHEVKDGCWTIICEEGTVPTWRFAAKYGILYDPVISEADVPDKVDPLSGAWGEFAAHTEKDIRNACRIPIRNPMRQGIIVSIDTGEGGDEMHKQLIHVILFNTKTETIDFKGYVPAKDETDAVMIAAQTYGSYDSNVHEVITKDVACYTKKD